MEVDVPIQSKGAKPSRFSILASLVAALAIGCGSGSSGPSQPHGTQNGGNGMSPTPGGEGTPSGSAGEPAQSSSGSGGASTSSGGSTPMGPALFDSGLDGAVTVSLDAGPLDAMLSPPRADLGKGDGTDVIMIGDSWMLLSVTGISLSLQKPANGGNPNYTNYAVPGTQLLNGQIPSQYTQAKAVKSSIKTVVMTAGGNDVLLTGLSSDCAAGGTTCQMKLNAIGMALGQLWDQMGKDGVTDVVHIMYAASAGGGLKDPAANQALIQTYCDAVPQPMHCHLLNTDMIVGKDLMADGIHPSAAACDRVAQAVTSMMQMYGMRR